jgi:hypothetical protein
MGMRRRRNMSTSVAAQMTPQGLLIPRDAILEWMEQGIEVIKETGLWQISGLNKYQSL